MPSKSPATDASNTATEEVDPAEVIKVNSNLVTVPASVIDDKGRAVTDLKLEDFELRVDGQPKPIGDLGRSETPVRMVMLFDNSDSLLAAREFEKQAAVRFFRHVMRPIDQAAVYSVSTDSSLAQPFTGDVRTLANSTSFPANRNEKTNVNTIPGKASGNVTWRSTSHRVAPSTSA